MKLICHSQHELELFKRLEKYEYLDVVLVEKGLDYLGVAYVFDILHLDDLESYLRSLELSTRVLYGKKGQRIYKIDIHNIVYIEGFSKEAYIHTDGSQFEVKEKLYELEETLGNYGFIRISKSLIINCYKIESLEPMVNMKYRIHMNNGEYVELTRNYLKHFKDYLKMR